MRSVHAVCAVFEVNALASGICLFQVLAEGAAVTDKAVESVCIGTSCRLRREIEVALRAAYAKVRSGAKDNMPHAPCSQGTSGGSVGAETRYLAQVYTS